MHVLKEIPRVTSVEFELQQCPCCVAQELSVPLTKWLKAFPAMSSLHPFEAALLDLTVGQGTYASVLGKVDMLRKSLQEVSGHPGHAKLQILRVSVQVLQGRRLCSVMWALGAFTVGYHGSLQCCASL